MKCKCSENKCTCKKLQTEDVIHSISTLPNLGLERRTELSEILEKIDYEIPYLRQGACI